MNVVAPATPHWTVSTRHDGEVLAVWCGGDDVRLGVLASPASFTPQEYEGWLTDLAGVARESYRAESEPQPIPALLHQAISGLLFSHVELWERAGGAHASIALISSGNEIGIGWVGDLDVEVAVDGEAVEVPWVIVRDAEGREARAARFDAGHWLRVGMMWTPREDSTDGAMIDAEWSGISQKIDLVPAAPAMPELADWPEVPEEKVAAPARTPAPAPAPARIAEPEMHPSEPPIARPAPPRPFIAEPPRPRENAFAKFWNWFTGKSKARPVMVETGDDPPWVDVGGAPVDDTEENYASAPGSHPAARAMPEPEAEDETQTLEVEAPAEPDDESLEPSPVANQGETMLVMDEPEAPVEEWTDEAPESESQEILEEAEPFEEETQEFTEVEEFVAPDDGNEIVPIGDHSSPARPSLISSVHDEAADLELEGVPFLNDPAAAPPAKRVPKRRPLPIEVEAAEADADARVPLRPRWPSPAELARPEPWWTRRWVWGVAIAILFGGGWMVGMQSDHDPNAAPSPNLFTRVLRAVGLGGAVYQCTIDSRPQGAWIAVDGKDAARRTPATIELKPGAHDVTLSFTDLGSASFKVTGARGDHASLDETLWGSLTVEQVNQGIPVTVAVDGRALGYVPAVLDSVSPGAHEVRFSGPGMTPWAQTVEVRVREAARVVAHPMTAPGTGVLVVNATLNDEQGSQALSGGEVWIDGQSRGRTPFTVELPRGPHSVRVVARGESAPVQVIDLPGGNQRFATFEIGLGAGGPQLVQVQSAEHVASDHPTLVSGALDGVRIADVREMWLHVRGSDGPWRRYALDIMKSPSGVIGVTVFPLGVFDGQGHTQYYLSALTATGDEFFTEMKGAELVPLNH